MTDFNHTPVCQCLCSVMGIAHRDLRFMCLKIQAKHTQNPSRFRVLEPDKMVADLVGLAAIRRIRFAECPRTVETIARGDQHNRSLRAEPEPACRNDAHNGPSHVAQVPAPA